MKKNTVVSILLTAVVAMWVSGCKLSEATGPEKNFTARLTGEQEVPSLNTKAHGQFTAVSRNLDTELSYKLSVGQIKNVTGAHLHLGKPGENGPPIVTLYPGPMKAGEFNATLAEAVITAAQLSGALENKTMREFVDEVRRGNVYVNVHTEQYPEGEIRGQIQ